jgi:hypothetical protein
MLLHCHPRRRHHTDNNDYCLVEGIEATDVFCQQLGGDVGIVIGIPAKEDCLHHLSGKVIIGLTQFHCLGLRGVELLLDG